VLADFLMIIEIGTIAGKYQKPTIPFQVNLIYLRTGYLGRYKVGIGKQNADSFSDEIVPSPDFYSLLNTSSELIQIRHGPNIIHARRKYSERLCTVEV
jgi:hypothetical protein